MWVERCRHIKTNGLVCGSPALTNKDFCFFHNRLHKTHPPFRQAPYLDPKLHPGLPIDISGLEDAESILMAISTVVNALAIGNLEVNRGRALLYGLQLAASNTRHTSPKPPHHEIIREVDPEAVMTKDLVELNLIEPLPPKPTAEEKAAIRNATRRSATALRKLAALESEP